MIDPIPVIGMCLILWIAFSTVYSVQLERRISKLEEGVALREPSEGTP